MAVRSHSWRKQSIRLVAARNGLSEQTLRRMCDASEVETIILNGVKYVPPRAEQKLRDDLGLPEPGPMMQPEPVKQRIDAPVYDGFPF